MTEVFNFRSFLGASPSTASTSDSTLIIIDAQNEYATGHLKVADVETSRSAIASLLNKYRAAKGNLIHVVHVPPEGAPIFTPGTHLAEEFEELKPNEGEIVVEKAFPGSFSGTNLKEHLDKFGTKKVVLVGYMAHACVSTTARQAHAEGYDVIVAEDAVGDRGIPGVDPLTLTKVALAEIGDVFGTLVRSSSII